MSSHTWSNFIWCYRRLFQQAIFHFAFPYPSTRKRRVFPVCCLSLLCVFDETTHSHVCCITLLIRVQFQLNESPENCTENQLGLLRLQEQQFQQQMRSNSQHGFSQQHVGPSHLHQQQPLQHQQTFATLPTPAQQAQGLQPPFGFTLPSSSSATCMSTSATRVGAPSHVHGAYGVSPSFLETGSHHTNAAAVSAVAAVAAAAAAMGGADATGGAATNRFLNQNSDTHYRSDHMAMQSILSNSNAYQIHTHPNIRQPHDAYNCLNPTFDPSMPAPLYPYASSASSQQSPGLNQANPG